MYTNELLDRVNKQILELMDQEGTNWCKPWVSRARKGHQNFFSKHKYQGVNVFITAMSPFSLPYWGTFKQWADAGYPVRKGQNAANGCGATPIFKYGTFVKEEEGEEKVYSYLKVHHIFNIEQTEYPLEQLNEGVPAPQNNGFHSEIVEAFVSRTHATVTHDGDRAFYAPSNDLIVMPPKELFHGTNTSTPEQSYYSTLLHELVHWTGNKTRLDRFPSERTTENYAKEELVAEIGAAQLCAILNVQAEPRPDHAQYLNHWKAAIKNSKTAVIKAFSQAGKAVEFLQTV